MNRQLNNKTERLVIDCDTKEGQLKMRHIAPRHQDNGLFKQSDNGQIVTIQKTISDLYLKYGIVLLQSVRKHVLCSTSYSTLSL